MAKRLQSILDHIQRRSHPAHSKTVSDAELLERFLREHDQAAFELLMWRHGPMVYSTCQRVLHHIQDAEDAFQASFLLLARKAATIGKRESLGGWLHKVAYRIALRAKTRSIRRGQLEEPLDELAIDDKCPDPADLSAWRELQRLMDAELSKIPEKYRTAFILCHLEGKTCEEAAQQLGCPRGTVLSRLGRARERLRARLVLRGWTSSSTSLVHLLDQHAPALGVMMPVLMNATVHSAVLLAAGKTLTGSVSGSVLDLLGEALREMRWSWLRYGSLLALLVFLGVAPIVWRCLAASPPPTPSVVSPCHDTSAQSNR